MRSVVRILLLTGLVALSVCARATPLAGPLAASAWMKRHSLSADTPLRDASPVDTPAFRQGGDLLAANTVARARPAAEATSEGRIAVIYPDLGEPYRSVFQQIVSGIEQRAPSRVVSIPLAKQTHHDQLQAELQDKGISVIIALGRHGLKTASELTNAIPVVGGAVLASPDDGPKTRTLVSLTPDPRLLLQHLKRLAPSVRRVFTVYSAQHNDWLIALAKKAAKAQGVELVAIETDDLRVALQRFHDIVDQAETGRDAIWLPQDTAVLDDQVVLPFVLQQAWDRSLIVFSSTLAHVRRGALFALYPDNVNMGHQLATSALDLIDASKPERTVQPLREVRLALNTRTAGHLSINLETIQEDVALLFPAR